MKAARWDPLSFPTGSIWLYSLRINIYEKGACKWGFKGLPYQSFVVYTSSLKLSGALGFAMVREAQRPNNSARATPHTVERQRSAATRAVGPGSRSQKVRHPAPVSPDKKMSSILFLLVLSLSLLMYMCVRVYIYIHSYIQIHTYTRMCIYLCTHLLSIYSSIYIYIYISVYRSIYPCIWLMCL